MFSVKDTFEKKYTIENVTGNSFCGRKI